MNIDIDKFAKALSEILSRKFNCDIQIWWEKKPEAIKEETSERRKSQYPDWC